MSLDILYAEGLGAMGLRRRQGITVRALPFAIRDGWNDSSVEGATVDGTAAFRSRAHIRGERYARDALSHDLASCERRAELCRTIARVG
jgi:hypothetical protein